MRIIYKVSWINVKLPNIVLRIARELRLMVKRS